ncbi:MAG: ACT domain-containing protein [Oscillospiraceae bacterium]
MAIKQISVFVENKPGRHADITGFLAESDISIRAFSIADTTDFGILRLIVSDTNKAAAVLKANAVAVSITDVVGIRVPDVAGTFANVVKILASEGENVEYAYAFLTPSDGEACIIVRVADNDKAVKVLNKNNIEVMSEDQIV